MNCDSQTGESMLSLPVVNTRTECEHSGNSRCCDKSMLLCSAKETSMVKDKANKCQWNKETSRQINKSTTLTEAQPTQQDNQRKCNKLMDIWSDINESDFLISSKDIYPSRKEELKDTEVSEETIQNFEELCEDQQDAFSKNNGDIGRTQLIEMEKDTGGSVPLAQSPYTLPLKHYD